MAETNQVQEVISKSNFNGNEEVNYSEVENLENNYSEDLIQEIHTSKLHANDRVEDCDSGSTGPDSRSQRITRKDANYRELSGVNHTDIILGRKGGKVGLCQQGRSCEVLKM